MDKPYWTVGKIRDALESLALTHQYSFIDSVRILHDQKKLVLMVRDTRDAEPSERIFNEYGFILPQLHEP